MPLPSRRFLNIHPLTYPLDKILLVDFLATKPWNQSMNHITPSLATTTALLYLLHEVEVRNYLWIIDCILPIGSWTYSIKVRSSWGWRNGTRREKQIEVESKIGGNVKTSTTIIHFRPSDCTTTYCQVQAYGIPYSTPLSSGSSRHSYR